MATISPFLSRITDDHIEAFTSRETNINWRTFKEQEPMLVDQILELRQLPWVSKNIYSLVFYIIKKGLLSDKQYIYLTNLYLKNVALIPQLQEQVAHRQTLLRLNQLDIDTKTKELLGGIMWRTTSLPLTDGQINAVKSISKKHSAKLANVNLKFTDDGWHIAT